MRVSVCRRVMIVAMAGSLVAIAVAQAEEPATFTFRGEVKHLTIEGGFWGIVAEDGQRYDPGKLPREFEQAGRKVRVVARRTPDQISYRQWGQLIEIVEITDDLGR